MSRGAAGQRSRRDGTRDATNAANAAKRKGNPAGAIGTSTTAIRPPSTAATAVSRFRNAAATVPNNTAGNTASRPILRISPMTLPKTTPRTVPATQPPPMASAICQYTRRAEAGSRAVIAAATAGSPEICIAAIFSHVRIGQRFAMLMAINPNRELTNNAEIKPAAVEPPASITEAKASSPLPEKAVTEAISTTADEVPILVMSALTVMPMAIEAAPRAAMSAGRSQVESLSTGWGTYRRTRCVTSFPARAVLLRSPDHLAGKTVVDAYRASAHAATTAFAEPGALARSVLHPISGEVTGELYLGFRLADQAAHVWDLARACGLVVELPTAVCEAAIDTTRQRFGDGPRPLGMMEAARFVAADAEPADRMAGFLGRRV